MRIAKYDPYRDKNDWVCEETHAYIDRMQNGPLARWPSEVLIQWPYRHADQFDKYEFLGFENFSFLKECWNIEKLPGREAFDSPKFCDNFKDIERRARIRFPEDWLAKYMLEHGTWNTPIVLLKNSEGTLVHPNSDRLRSPYHLLEGHRRLSFLNGLRETGKAKSEHEVWIATVALNEKTT